MKTQTKASLNRFRIFLAASLCQRPRPRRIQTGHLPAGSSRPARHADPDPDSRNTASEKTLDESKAHKNSEI
jgi:hypothetical protein